MAQVIVTKADVLYLVSGVQVRTDAGVKLIFCNTGIFVALIAFPRAFSISATEMSLGVSLFAKASKPKRIAMGRWHLPYVTQQERDEYDEKICRMLSVARCARVSYAKHDGSAPDVKEDCELHDNLKKNLHMSAFEHQATPTLYVCKNAANFYGWKQYRQEIPNENRPTYPGFS